MSLLATILTALALLRGPAEVNVSGQVFLKSETAVPADYVMVYVPSLKIGVLSDDRGNFSIALPESSQKLKLEFSRIGYENTYLEVSTSQEDLNLGEIFLEPQVLMLTAAYVTPEGMTTEQYLLSKIWENVDKNHKKKISYEADIKYDFSTHEIPVIANAFTKGQVNMAKFVGSIAGFGPLVKYCLQNDDISAHAELSRSVVKGKARDYNQRITKSNPDPLPANVQKDIIEFFGKIDLFNLLYGDTSVWGKSFTQKHSFTLIGTYAYGDKLVDVLSYTDRKKLNLRIHLVEDDWGVMKLQVIREGDEVMRVEARDTGDGVFMPVSFILSPRISNIKNAQIPKLIEMIEADKHLKKAGKARIISILQERHEAGLDFNPYIACGFSVRYK